MSSGNLDEMIVAATAGDRTALESLLLRHHDPLLRYLRSLIARQHLHIDAEDALQEAFVEAFRRIKTFESRGEAAFDAWLKTVARTRLSNLLKAQRASKRETEARDHHKTGTLFGPVGRRVESYRESREAPPADTWFTMEIQAQGNHHLTVIVDGKKTADYVDQQRHFEKGGLALQVWSAGTVVKFRDIKIKE